MTCSATSSRATMRSGVTSLFIPNLCTAPPQMRNHGFSRRVERGLRRGRVGLTNAVDADPVGRRRLVRFELGAELARDHPAALVDLHDPCAAHEIEVVVDRALDDLRTESEPPGVGVASEWFSQQAEVFAERVTLDEKVAV